MLLSSATFAAARLRVRGGVCADGLDFFFAGTSYFALSANVKIMRKLYLTRFGFGFKEVLARTASTPLSCWNLFYSISNCENREQGSGLLASASDSTRVLHGRPRLFFAGGSYYALSAIMKRLGQGPTCWFRIWIRADICTDGLDLS